MLEASRKGKKKGKRKQPYSIKRTQETIISNFWRVVLFCLLFFLFGKLVVIVYPCTKKNFVHQCKFVNIVACTCLVVLTS